MTSRARTGRVQRRPSQPAPAPRRLPLAWLLVGLTVLLAAAALVAVLLAPAPAAPGGEAAEPAARPVEVSGAPLPTLPEAGGDPAVGQPLPTLRGVDFEGEASVVDPGDGRAKLILTLAHWCPHCQAEVPTLVAWLDDNPLPEGIELVAVATAIDPSRPNFPPSAWLAREDWPGQVLVDDGQSSALAALGLNSFPGWVLVDSDGRVLRRMTGELGAEAYPSIMEALR